ncbi:MAG: bifunctional oligoribonuclease/PAP phosphatase NrnA [Bacteroidota bacterium]
MLQIGKSELNDLRKAIDGSSSIVITTHHNPDGDAIGSVLGLYHALKAMGVNTQMLTPNGFPDFLGWLPDADKIVHYSKDKKAAENLLSKADLVFCLDFNGFKRVEDMAEALEKSPAKRVLIDHHPEPESPFHISISFTEVSSTAELVYEVVEQLYGEKAITFDAAVSLYTGIMTDTGSFSYACSRERTFTIAGKLIAKGVTVEEVQGLVYNNFSENRMRLLGFSLAERMRVYPEHRAACIWLTRSDLNRFKHQIGDTEGFVNYPLSIKGIIFSVLFTENDGFIKVSLRSRGNFAANTFSKLYYQGGGHKNAAGGKAFMSMDEAVKQFEELIAKHTAELNE